MTCLNALARSEVPPITEQLGFDISRVLHGEERFKYIQTIYAGDRITLQDEVKNIYEKKGGALKFVEVDTTLTNQKGELVGTKTTTIVIR